MKRALLLLAALLAATPALSDSDPVVVDAPRWVNPADGFTARVSVSSVAVVSATIVYADQEPIPCTVELDETGWASINAPGVDEFGYGPATLTITVGEGDEARTIERAIPASFFKDIDITGPAAESLLHPLPDEAVLVDYIPCCNIYGGQLLAERVPINPHENEVGLPSERFSDFVLLDPDGLTASTMGLYFEFAYEADIAAADVAVYEWNELDWREVFAYEADGESKRVRFHCPDGGTFVLARKP